MAFAQAAAREALLGLLSRLEEQREAPGVLLESSFLQDLQQLQEAHPETHRVLDRCAAASCLNDRRTAFRAVVKRTPAEDLDDRLEFFVHAAFLCYFCPLLYPEDGLGTHVLLAAEELCRCSAAHAAFAAACCERHHVETAREVLRPPFEELVFHNLLHTSILTAETALFHHLLQSWVPRSDLMYSGVLKDPPPARFLERTDERLRDMWARIAEEDLTLRHCLVCGPADALFLACKAFVEGGEAGERDEKEEETGEGEAETKAEGNPAPAATPSLAGLVPAEEAAAVDGTERPSRAAYDQKTLLAVMADVVDGAVVLFQQLHVAVYDEVEQTAWLRPVELHNVALSDALYEALLQSGLLQFQRLEETKCCYLLTHALHSRSWDHTCRVLRRAYASAYFPERLLERLFPADPAEAPRPLVHPPLCQQLLLSMLLQSRRYMDQQLLLNVVQYLPRQTLLLAPGVQATRTQLGDCWRLLLALVRWRGVDQPGSLTVLQQVVLHCVEQTFAPWTPQHQQALLVAQGCQVAQQLSAHQEELAQVLAWACGSYTASCAAFERHSSKPRLEVFGRWMPCLCRLIRPSPIARAAATRSAWERFCAAWVHMRDSKAQQLVLSALRPTLQEDAELFEWASEAATSVRGDRRLLHHFRLLRPHSFTRMDADGLSRVLQNPGILPAWLFEPVELSGVDWLVPGVFVVLYAVLCEARDAREDRELCRALDALVARCTQTQSGEGLELELELELERERRDWAFVLAGHWWRLLLCVFVPSCGVFPAGVSALLDCTVRLLEGTEVDALQQGQPMEPWKRFSPWAPLFSVSLKAPPDLEVREACGYGELQLSPQHATWFNTQFGNLLDVLIQNGLQRDLDPAPLRALWHARPESSTPARMLKRAMRSCVDGLPRLLRICMTEEELLAAQPAFVEMVLTLPLLQQPSEEDELAFLEEPASATQPVVSNTWLVKQVELATTVELPIGLSALRMLLKFMHVEHALTSVQEDRILYAILSNSWGSLEATRQALGFWCNNTPSVGNIEFGVALLLKRSEFELMRELHDALFGSVIASFFLVKSVHNEGWPDYYRRLCGWARAFVSSCVLYVVTNETQLRSHTGEGSVGRAFCHMCISLGLLQPLSTYNRLFSSNTLLAFDPDTAETAWQALILPVVRLPTTGAWRAVFILLQFFRRGLPFGVETVVALYNKLLEHPDLAQGARPDYYANWRLLAILVLLFREASRLAAIDLHLRMDYQRVQKRLLQRLRAQTPEVDSELFEQFVVALNSWTHPGTAMDQDNESVCYALQSLRIQLVSQSHETLSRQQPDISSAMLSTSSDCGETLQLLGEFVYFHETLLYPTNDVEEVDGHRRVPELVRTAMVSYLTMKTQPQEEELPFYLGTMDELDQRVRDVVDSMESNVPDAVRCLQCHRLLVHAPDAPCAEEMSTDLDAEATTGSAAASSAAASSRRNRARRRRRRRRRA